MPSEIISEQRATSNRNGARDHPGIPGDFRRNPQIEDALLLRGTRDFVDLDAYRHFIDEIMPG
jgi:hypothetical protein